MTTTMIARESEALLPHLGRAERPDPDWVRGTCPECGEALVLNAYHIGGRGYVLVRECWASLGEAPTGGHRVEENRASPSCRGAEMGGETQFVGAEDVLTYTCPEHGEYLVTISQDENGVWVIAAGDEERCPMCGKFGICREDSGPDTFWDAAERCGEERPDSVIETSGGPLLFSFI